jgi:SRSO17 transposase
MAAAARNKILFLLSIVVWQRDLDKSVNSQPGGCLVRLAWILRQDDSMRGRKQQPRTWKELRNAATDARNKSERINTPRGRH